jgi:sterol desaturase/sphingolipid hydroxylase (fatty acid hydroxylase superfamily)
MFGLADHPKIKHAMRGSPRMFKSDFVEKYLSRVRPVHVLAVWLPIIGYLCWQSLARGATPLAFSLTLLGGVFFWTLLEYVLHRYVFHFEPHGEMQEDLSFLIHGVHHDYPWDPDRLVMPPTVSLLIGAALYFPMLWLTGPVLFGAAFAGTALGYLWYDISHYAFHHWKPSTRVGRYLRSYHLVHHFKTPELRYGVSTPLWDYVFRTQPRADEKKSRDSGDEAAAHG